jgi:hypothetical protein
MLHYFQRHYVQIDGIQTNTASNKQESQLFFMASHPLQTQAALAVLAAMAAHPSSFYCFKRRVIIF